MEFKNTIDFIQQIYDSYNISHSLVIYRKTETTSNDIMELSYHLKNNDFPMFHITDIPEDLSLYEMKYRMFLIEYDKLIEFIRNKDNNLSNISVIFCLSSSVLHSTSNLLQNLNLKTFQSMHLFSC